MLKPMRCGQKQASQAGLLTLSVPGYAALGLVTDYAGPWLRYDRVSFDSLQTWWSCIPTLCQLHPKTLRCNKLFSIVWVSIVVASGKFSYRCRSGVPAQRTTLRRLSRALFMC